MRAFCHAVEGGRWELAKSPAVNNCGAKKYNDNEAEFLLASST
jgi:hypothetical protein